MNVKFRGKDQNNKWVYGYHVHYDNSDKPDQNGPSVDLLLCQIGELLQIESFKMVEVDPTTLCISTGEHDMCKDMIYTGDIVRVLWVKDDENTANSKYETYVVDFKNGTYYCRKWGSNNYVSSLRNFTGKSRFEDKGVNVFVQIVGNIIDNPEP